MCLGVYTAKINLFNEIMSGASNDGNCGSGGLVPSYARPSVASRLPDFSNAAAEAIRAAFVPNSFTTIGSLGKVMDAEAPGAAAPSFRAGGHSATHCGTFSDFVYASSPYDLVDEQKAALRRQHEDQMRHIAAGRDDGADAGAADHQPFFAGYSAFKTKAEAWGLEYLSDPYDLKDEHAKQERWLAESQALGKAFLPPGVQKALDKPTRAMLGDAMTALFRTISQDWPEAQPTVLSTAEDLVVVYFLLSRIKSAHGVLT